MTTALIKTLLVDDEPVARKVMREELALFATSCAISPDHDPTFVSESPYEKRAS